jgi:C-terminal processing protease CtpA/Prc
MNFTYRQRNLNFLAKGTLLMIVFSSLLILSSCDEDDDKSSNPVPKSNLMGFIDTLMHDYYLWYDKIPITIKKDDFANAQAYYDALQYKEKDKWSFMISESEYEKLVDAGGTDGFGFYIKQEEDLSIKVFMIYKTSEAYAQGIRRGDYIATINGSTVNNQSYNLFYNGFLGDVLEIGIKKTKNGPIQYYSLTREEISQDPIVHKDIFQVNGNKVGYLVYENFFEYTEAGLVSAFSEFQANNVSDLIIDLRYNGGGQISLMSKIIGMIAPPQYNGQVSAKVVHNDKIGPYYDENRYIYIEDINLNLDRLFVITSGNSASASESLINELKPYIDVYTVGSWTHGKPVGMYGFEKQNILFFPITFKLLNANDEGEYFGGIAPSSHIPDPVSHSFGDLNEPCLKEALHFIEFGSFTGSLATSFPRSSDRGYYKPQLFNILIDDFSKSKDDQH